MSKRPTHTAGLKATQHALQEAAIILLSAEDQLALVKAIGNPPEPNEALRRAADAHKRLVVKSRP